MTSNTAFKTDATQLLNLILKFKKTYGSQLRGNAELFENDLRMMLHIARTDEENTAQRALDLYC